jgi:two-component system LytT family response regulator
MASIVERFDNVEVIAQCRNGRQAIQQVHALHPDLLILDVQMPEMDGFDVVKSLQADVLPLVIFATAFDQYALDAFDQHAVDYVLKPFDPDRVRLAVDRAMERNLASRLDDRKEPIMNLIGSMLRQEPLDREAEGGEQKLAVRDGDTVTLIPFEEIDWVDAAGDYMCVHSRGKTHVMRSTMKQLEEKLDADCFARIHRSTLVNLSKICSIQSLPKGEYRVDLGGENILKVSRNFRKSVQHLLK